MRGKIGRAPESAKMTEKLPWVGGLVGWWVGGLVGW
jgi:hypothetical protein